MKTDLPTHHYVWLFDAASEHFEAEITRLELEIIRHDAFRESPIAQARQGPTQDRKARIKECYARIEEYRAILDFSRACAEKLKDKSAKEFAEGFWAHLKSKEKKTSP